MPAAFLGAQAGGYFGAARNEAGAPGNFKCFHAEEDMSSDVCGATCAYGRSAGR